MKRNLFFLLILCITLACEIESNQILTNGRDFMLYVNVSEDPESSRQSTGILPAVYESRSLVAGGAVDPMASRPRPDRRERPGFESFGVSRAFATGLTPSDKTAKLYVDRIKKDFTLMYGDASSEVLIYAETSRLSSYASFNWDALGSRFDDSIYPTVTGVFGDYEDVDENEKVVMICYQMSEDNIAGYFWATDLQLSSSTNGMDAFFINLPMLGYNTESLDGLIAHEFQHLVNGSRRIFRNNNLEMEAWLDEALAEYAAFLLDGNIKSDHIASYSADVSGVFRNGLGLVSWDGDMPDYTLSYLFAAYLRAQAGSDDIFKSIIDHESPGAAAVLNVMKAVDTEFNSFSKIITAFRVANLGIKTSGIYSYESDSADFKFNNYEPTSVARLTHRLSAGGAFYINYPVSGQSGVSLPSTAGKNIVLIKGSDID
ncbi:MAG: hypothetical protein JXR63_03765 [Spirochaetales bacterium]|nr:hypothetical protein [Spirochaetales bacterium]